MDGSREYHTRSGKAEYCIISLIGRMQKIIQMSLYSKQKQTHKHRKQIYGSQRGKGGHKLGIWD